VKLRKGTILNDRYLIKKSFSYGGFGAVYLAQDIKKDIICAVKENLDNSHGTALSNFLREASMLYNLRHPNLPEVWDHFVIPGEGQYLVMEYIEGRSLAYILEKNGKPLPESKVIPWITQVCDALTYLHSQSPPIIHRDIKPSNIRITPEGKAVLVDFGIAKFYDEFSQTSTVARAVTPGYSPLEQYGIGKTDERSDVYALAATVYRLLTLRTPLPSVDVAAGTAETPIAANKINPKLSNQTSQAIQRAMRLRVKDRTHSVAQFKNELNKGMKWSSDPQYMLRRNPLYIGFILFIVLFTVGYIAYLMRFF